MNKQKFYLQPLGLLRGCSAFKEGYPSIAARDLHFSAVRIIERNDQNIKVETIPSSDFENYLKTRDSDEAALLKNLMGNITCERLDILLEDGKSLSFGELIIQGILNVTPDSFSDGGLFDDNDAALTHAKSMTQAGAKIIDVGGETTKPGAQPVPEALEKSRVVPIIEKLSGEGFLVSIDSRNASVMSAALDTGAQIINDVSALEHDPESIKVVSESGAPIILMHAQGSPEVMQKDPKYDSAVLDIYDYLEKRIEYCVQHGVDKGKIIVDPGIGFGKTVDHNLEILANITVFHGLGVPILIGVSRKSFIGKVTGEEQADKRVSGSIAAAQHCIDQGVQIVRVHDVEETGNALSIYSSIVAKSALV